MDVLIRFAIQWALIALVAFAINIFLRERR
jgi:hypothetical protein